MTSMERQVVELLNTVVSFYPDWWHLLLLGFGFLSLLGAIVLYLFFSNVDEKEINEAEGRAGHSDKKDSRKGLGKEDAKKRSGRHSQGDASKQTEKEGGIGGSSNETDSNRSGSEALPGDIEIVQAGEEEQSEVKYIGYEPINIFSQTEPLNYPYVIMPKPKSVIKFPRKGRIGRKGYKEEDFKQYLEQFFRNQFELYDDRFILVKKSAIPYEPDFSLIDEQNGVNMFIDVEIDEPYEGLNDIQVRKPTHYQGLDTNRNNALRNRGWIVIRFAEIQVHQTPEACCRFIADVIKSVHPSFPFPEALSATEMLKPVLQWTKEEAQEWSHEKYREQYLGISEFGETLEKIWGGEVEETELGQAIETEVLDDQEEVVEEIPAREKSFEETIALAISDKKYLSFSWKDERTIVQPIMYENGRLRGFCYVKNKKRDFDLEGLRDMVLKDNYYTLQLMGPSIGVERVASAIHTAIRYKKYIRMQYTRVAWTDIIIDGDTGKPKVNHVDQEKSTRTISNVLLSKDALTDDHITYYNLNEHYITAYCHRREAQRTFKFNRISMLEILDL